MLPLPLLQAGVLRLWPSRVHFGADSLSIAFQGPELTADAAVASSAPLHLNLTNSWCASLDPPVCLGLVTTAANEDRAAEAAAIVMFGLIGAAGCFLLLSADIFRDVWRALCRKGDSARGHEDGDPYAEAREGRWVEYYDPPQDSAESAALRVEMLALQERARAVTAQLLVEEDRAMRKELAQMQDKERRLQDEIASLVLKRYWYHTRTGETTWQDPASASDMPPPTHELQQQQPPHLEEEDWDNDDAYGQRSLQEQGPGVELSLAPAVNGDLVFTAPARPPDKDPMTKADNSMMMASLLGQSSWMRDNGLADKNAAEAGKQAVMETLAV